jgi:hypothetical protein
MLDDIRLRIRLLEMARKDVAQLQKAVSSQDDCREAAARITERLAQILGVLEDHARDTLERVEHEQGPGRPAQ